MTDTPNTGCLPPSQSDRVSAAWQQLHLVLGFFPRVDRNLSVVLGINLTLLAVLRGDWGGMDQEPRHPDVGTGAAWPWLPSSEAAQSRFEGAGA